MTKLTLVEVDETEQSLGLRLPTLYRKLLVEEGRGVLSPEAEIYHPAEVQELYEPFFDEPEQLFNPYFPFGNNPRTQELWVISADAERAASIWHETVPEGWAQEEWLPYDEWTRKYLESPRAG